MCNNCCENNKLDKMKVLEYSYYDESHQLVAVLNRAYLQEVFGADIIVLEEKEHK